MGNENGQKKTSQAQLLGGEGEGGRGRGEGELSLGGLFLSVLVSHDKLCQNRYFTSVFS